jgi:hypothetical protein
MQRLIVVLAGACVVAGLSVLAQMASPLDGAQPLYWPATGLAFAMLCTQGKHPAWSVALDVGLAGLLLNTHSQGFLPFIMLAAVAGPWLSWQRLKVTFASTSQPFARLNTVLAFLHIQVLQGAPLSASVLVTAVDRESAHALKEEAEQAERIRQIIQQKQLVLYAQPIVANVNPGAMPHKYEVQIRLRDAQGGIIPPGVFLPVAIQAGMMQLLDMSVVEQTFEWFAPHPHALDKLNQCAIKLSGPTVASPVIAIALHRN